MKIVPRMAVKHASIALVLGQVVIVLQSEIRRSCFVA